METLRPGDIGVTFDAKMTFETHLPELQLRGLVSWESAGKYFIIRHFFWDLFEALSCWSWSIAQNCGAQLSIHTLNYWTEMSGVLVFSWRYFRMQPCPSTICIALLCMLFKIKSNPMHPLNGTLPLPYVTAGVPLGAFVAYWHSFAPPPCRT